MDLHKSDWQIYIDLVSVFIKSAPNSMLFGAVTNNTNYMVWILNPYRYESLCVDGIESGKPIYEVLPTSQSAQYFDFRCIFMLVIMLKGWMKEREKSAQVNSQ